MVAFEVATCLPAPMTLLITRKIGCPSAKECAFAVLSEDGYIFGDQQEIQKVDQRWFQEQIEQETAEITRRSGMSRNAVSAVFWNHEDARISTWYTTDSNNTTGNDMDINTDWHLKHTLPQNSTLDQRVEWHMLHARRCSCPSHDDDIKEELQRRYLGTHQDFWIFFNTNDHAALGLWAAECAERVLPYFERTSPEDIRPREAIKTLREWSQTHIFRMSVIRAASLGAHASAKQVEKEDIIACYAAHAAGQAVGTAHVPTHALGTVLYAIRLIVTLHPEDAKTAVTQERDWQTQHLPEHLRSWVDAWFERTFPLLPKHIREQCNMANNLH